MNAGMRNEQTRILVRVFPVGEEYFAGEAQAEGCVFP